MRNKNLLTTAVIVVVVLVAAGALLAMRKSDNTKSSTSQSSMSSTDTSKTDTSKSSTTADQNTVAIKDFAFNPGTITVKVGTKVTWTNEDSVAHTVTADTASSDAPASNSIGKGDSYSFTFNKAGTYDYHCTPHPYMKATVIVTQ
ncbi:MAG: cupredoxin family copper-binding protein [Candidatus Saccharimonadales bacterium]